MNHQEFYTNNVLYNKSYKFAIRTVNAYKYLVEEKKEYILSKQLIRSGTSIGDNVAEANGAISTADFSAKLSIAYKECLETKYWLCLLKIQIILPTKLFKVFTKMQTKLEDYFLQYSKRQELTNNN